MKSYPFLALLAVWVLAACASPTPTPTPPPTPTPAPAPTSLAASPTSAPRPAPDFKTSLFQGQDVLGAETLQFSQLLGKGKPVVLNFWAGLCAVCRIEMTELQAFYEKYKDEVILYGLHIGPFVGLGSKQDALDRIQALGITYPVGSTNEAKVLKEYGFMGMPTLYFITSDGNIFLQWTGFLDEASLVKIIEEMARAEAVNEGPSGS